MATTRTINKQKYNVTELVQNAIAAADSKPLDIEKARQSLHSMGHHNPDDEIIARYARESAILNTLTRETGANFNGQIGKISFSSTEKTVADVEAYLARRNTARKAGWNR